MKKFLPYILILILLVGLFAPTASVQAEDEEKGTCSYTVFVAQVGERTRTVPEPVTYTRCVEIALADNARGVNDPIWNPGSTPEVKTEGGAPSAFEQTLNEECSLFSPIDCIAPFLYYTVFQVSALILAISANFFNVMISIALDSTQYTASFISEAWEIVRDMSNIFFILILLYIAFQTILGLGGQNGPKKMIAQVIIMALLINFSMFFTKIVIDSSNILALVFYNKLSVETTTEGQSSPRPYEPSTSSNEKDISGGMKKAFDATQLVSEDFFKEAKSINTLGQTVNSDKVPLSIKIGMIVVAGTIMLFAAYAFFVAGLCFLGRLIELWVLIIFSPFAFMSSIIPILSKVESIGWESWLKKLLSASFMAPIFMFFMYLIFKLVHAEIFGGFLSGKGILANTLSFIIPAMIILALLLKATEYAKKGGGKFGEVAMAGAKMAGGLALGAATGGAAMLGTGLAGGLASKAMTSKGLQDASEEKGTFKGFAARAALRTADYGTQASFDIRKVPGVSALAKAGGVDLESASKVGLGSKEGGYEQRRAEKIKKDQERAKRLEVREDEPLKQELNKLEGDLQGLLVDNSHALELIDKKITTARQNLSDANARFGAGSAEALGAGKNLADLKGQKSARKNGTEFTDSFGVEYDFTHVVTADGNSINNLENTIIPDAHHKLEAKSKSRKRAYADRIGKKKLWGSTNREAAHQIRMGAKLDSGAKEEGH